MPAYELAFPPTTTGVKLKNNGHDYPIMVGVDTFVRNGVDGDEVILPLFAGDEFVGDVLEGQWLKGCDPSNINAVALRLYNYGDALYIWGNAAVAGTAGNAWINGINPLPLMNNTQITFEMEIPADIADAPTHDFNFDFWLDKLKVTWMPVQVDSIFTTINVNSSGMLLQVGKCVNSVWTTLFDGSTYDDSTSRTTGTGKFLIWRYVIHDPHIGFSYRHIHVYLKQSTSWALAEAATEYELTTSPYDISDLRYNVAYPAYRIQTANTTYFATPAISQYVRVTYPDFEVDYDIAEANVLKGECKIFDTMGSGTETNWQRVRDIDHVFVGDCVVQNGLLRVWVHDVAVDGLKIGCAISGAWVNDLICHDFWLDLSGAWTFTDFPHLESIEYISSEKISIIVQSRDSAVVDWDYMVRVKYIIERGKQSVQAEILSTYPVTIRGTLISSPTYPNYGATTSVYSQTILVGDLNLAQDAQDDKMHDNFAVGFSPTGITGANIIYSLSTLTKPLYNFMSYHGGRLYIQEYTVSQNPTFIISILPFPLCANLAKEAESAIIGSASKLYLGASGEDSCTENQAVWAATTNCAVAVNDTARHNVGSYDVKITGTAAGAVLATCTPTTPYAKLKKFDSLKLWASRSGATYPATIEIRLRSDASNYVKYTLTITASATKYTIPIPYSATDLQGWTQVGTMVFTGFATLTIGWTAVGATEIVYIDGLHEYIGNTTIRTRDSEAYSNNSAVVLQNNPDYAMLIYGVANTTLPTGRYIFIARMKSVDGSQIKMGGYDYTTTKFINEGTQQDYDYLPAISTTFKYYAVVVDVPDNGDTIAFTIYNTSATELFIIDYMLALPVGNQMTFPQNIAHNTLRKVMWKRKISRRIT